AAAALRAHVLSADFASVLAFAAPTAPMQALAAERDRALAAAREASPAIALLRALGLAGDTLRLVASLSAPGDARVLVHVETSRDPPLGVFAIDCHHGASRTSFGLGRATVDELELGTCDVLSLPGWLARAADRLNVTWTVAIRRLSPKL